MKALQTLIKLHKRKLDEIGTKILNLEEEKLSIVKLLQDLDQSLKKEIEKFAMNLEFAFMMERYSDRVNLQNQEYNDKILGIERKIIDLREDLRVEFTKLKKFEHVLKNRIKKEKQEIERKQEIEISDSITMKYNHK